MPTGTRGPRTTSRTGIRVILFTRIPGQVASMAVAVRKNVLPQRQSQNHLAVRVLTWIKQRDKNEVSLQGSIHRRIEVNH